MKNYFSRMMSEGYDLLVEDIIKWPSDLAPSQKVELLQQAIKYFENLEEYEKCAVLQKKIEDMFSPKPRPRRRRSASTKRATAVKKLKV